MNTLTDLWYPALVALVGFIVRSARFGVKSVKSSISGALCSVFSGIVTIWILDGSDLSEGIKLASVALTGYSGGIALDSALFRFTKFIRGDAAGTPPETPEEPPGEADPAPGGKTRDHRP